MANHAKDAKKTIWSTQNGPQVNVFTNFLLKNS